MAKRSVDKTALIDGDMIAFRIASAVETPIDWGDDLWTLHSDLGLARDLLDSKMAEIMEETGCTKARFAVSGRQNFRFDLYPAYKANRKGTRKPIILSPLMEYALATYNGFRKDEMEADDVLGIWQTNSPRHTSVIVSGDKDMRTIPGLHYNPEKQHEGVITVTPAQAERTHMVQVLTGDATDNIPGCPTYGPVTADRAVPRDACLVDMWEAVVDCFIKKGQGPEEALLNARLTRILHNTDYDFEVSAVKYWEPPQQ